MSDLRCEDVYGDELQLCSDCRNDLERCEGQEEKMYLDYVNNYLTLTHFSIDYGIEKKLCEIILAEGKRINNNK